MAVSQLSAKTPLIVRLVSIFIAKLGKGRLVFCLECLRLEHSLFLEKLGHVCALEKKKLVNNNNSEVYHVRIRLFPVGSDWSSLCLG